MNHVDVATQYYNRSIVLECLGENDEALMAFEAALGIQKKFFPERYRSLSSTENQYRIKNFLLAKKVL